MVATDFGKIDATTPDDHAPADRDLAALRVAPLSDEYGDAISDHIDRALDGGEGTSFINQAGLPPRWVLVQVTVSPESSPLAP